MTHQRAPGFGRPPQVPNDINHLNYVTSGFWAETNKFLWKRPSAKVTSNDNLNLNLNPFSSSSSSLGPINLFDSPDNLYNSNNNNISLRKLKARTEDNISNNIPLDQYHPSIPTANSRNGNIGGVSVKKKNRRGSCMECVFCKNNGQPQSFYQNHVLKDLLGRVTCPILFAYDCPICHNGGGARAHTVRYCPQNKPSNRLRNAMLKSQSFTPTTDNSCYKLI